MIHLLMQSAAINWIEEIVEEIRMLYFKKNLIIHLTLILVTNKVTDKGYI